jgi:hypothetical protein
LDDSETTRRTHEVLSFMGVTALARKKRPPDSFLNWELETKGIIEATYPDGHSQARYGPFFSYLKARGKNGR